MIICWAYIKKKKIKVQGKSGEIESEKLGASRVYGW